jgi:hypothetical protein
MLRINYNFWILVEIIVNMCFCDIFYLTHMSFSFQ